MVFELPIAMNEFVINPHLPRQFDSAVSTENITYSHYCSAVCTIVSLVHCIKYLREFLIPFLAFPLCLNAFSPLFFNMCRCIWSTGKIASTACPFYVRFFRLVREFSHTVIISMLPEFRNRLMPVQKMICPLLSFIAKIRADFCLIALKPNTLLRKLPWTENRLRR